MAQVQKSFGLDEDLIDRAIRKGNETQRSIGEKVKRTLDTLVKIGNEAKTLQDPSCLYPREILVGGKDEREIDRAYRSAVRETGLSDYAIPNGKVYR